RLLCSTHAAASGSVDPSSQVPRTPRVSGWIAQSVVGPMRLRTTVTASNGANLTSRACPHRGRGRLRHSTSDVSAPGGRWRFAMAAIAPPYARHRLALRLLHPRRSRLTGQAPNTPSDEIRIDVAQAITDAVLAQLHERQPSGVGKLPHAQH